MWCQHKGRGGSSRSIRHCSISEKLTPLWAGVWLTPVCISCTEKNPLHLHSTNPSHDKFSRQKLTLTETTDVNTTPSTQVQTHHDTPGCVQQWSKRGFYRAFPHNCSFWGCTEVWMNRAHSSQFASQLQHPLWAPTCPGFTTQPQLLMVPFLHRRARTRHSWNSWNPQKQGTKALHKPNRPHLLAAKGCQTDPTASQTIFPNPPSLIVQLFHLIKFKFLAPGIESTDFSLEAYHHTSWQPSSG